MPQIANEKTSGNGNDEQTPADLLALNRECRCWPIEAGDIVGSLPSAVGSALDERHENLFAGTGVFLHAADLLAMRAQIDAIEAVVVQAPYLARITAGASVTSDTRGVLMGYDFHLTALGPRLIEINTNAGGAFLVSHLQRTLGLPGVAKDNDLIDMFAREWQRSGASGRLRTIAIVDDNPPEQYLFADMLLAAETLRGHIDNVLIVDRADLQWDGAALTCPASEHPIDLVYNRLTDFSLEEADSQALRSAWQSGGVTVTPSPDHHRLLANKLNLQLLNDTELLDQLVLSSAERQALAELPQTRRVSASNADELWQERKALFFKPAAGFGGRAAYRGAKLSRKNFMRIIADSDHRPYVAQTLVPPAQRTLARAEDHLLKFDLRVYSYAAQPLLLAARVYEGQTTNFRTSGGGFAPVAVLSGESN